MKLPICLIFASLLFGCESSENPSNPQEIIIDSTFWTVEKLGLRAIDNQDSTLWDTALFQQDIETYATFSEVFKSFPLNKSPFPVAEYDYAVSNEPFTLSTANHEFKGVSLGECSDPDCEKIDVKMTLIVANEKGDLEESTLVDSRNYPYLTGQGSFIGENTELDWVLNASPDGISFLTINMKLFDLRFGETIVIFPKRNGSFHYLQLNESPNNFQELESFKKAIRDKIDLKWMRN